MAGISENSIDEFRERVQRFDRKYKEHWDNWLVTDLPSRPEIFGVIMRKWQACRPNPMRRIRAGSKHEAPYLEDLIRNSQKHLLSLRDFDIGKAESFTDLNKLALGELWKIFLHLSYAGKSRGGLSGAVGISKAVLLLSDGRIGPAFDSKVRGHLRLKRIEDSIGWIQALEKSSDDIRRFELANQITLANAVPNFAHLNNGRIYDMALGPGLPNSKAR